MKIITVYFFLLTGLLASFQIRAEAPFDVAQLTSPEGYEWHPCRQKESGCAFLVPEGWTVWHAVENGRFVTQIVSPGREVEQGVISLSVVKHVRQQTGFNAIDNMRLLMQDIEKSGHYKIDEWHQENMPFKSRAISAVYYTSERVARRYFYLLIGNEDTDTLYRIKFTAPDASWNKLWPKAEQVFRKLYLNEKK